MIRTAITELLGIRHPIIQGGLQGLGRARLAAAVSNAGALGTITAGCFETPEDLAEEIALCRSLTSKPFAVNISIGSRRSMAPYLACALANSVDRIMTSGNNPEPFASQIKESGAVWVHVSPAIRYAQKAESLGADAIVLVGFEAGGHPGMDDVALSVLVREAKKALSVPVIAAGGISDGCSLVAAMAWGAGGVMLGTRFVLTAESPLHESIKQALLKASDRDTIIIERSLRKARRVFKTSNAEKVIAMERQGAGYEQLKHIVGGEAYLRTIFDGDLNSGVLSIGQVIALLNSSPPAGEVVTNMMHDAQQTIASLGRLVQTEACGV